MLSVIFKKSHSQVPDWAVFEWKYFATADISGGHNKISMATKHLRC